MLAEADATPLLVFDEVDANVGCRSRCRAGQCAWQKTPSPLCDPPSPVASLAHNHYVVTKSQDKDSTAVDIASLGDSRSDRLEELARMLGDRKSASAERMQSC